MQSENPTNNLCIISDDQFDEYQDEFAWLKKEGVDFVFESSPELALAMIGASDPSLVVVGTDLGDYEGIEFLAMMMSRYSDFDKPVIVLPEKDDGIPPMLHSRGNIGGKSSVEKIDFEQMAKLAMVMATSDKAAQNSPSKKTAVLKNRAAGTQLGMPAMTQDKLKQSIEDRISPKELLGFDSEPPLAEESDQAHEDFPALQPQDKQISEIGMMKTVAIADISDVLSPEVLSADKAAAFDKSPQVPPDAQVPPPKARSRKLVWIAAAVVIVVVVVGAAAGIAAIETKEQVAPKEEVETVPSMPEQVVPKEEEEKEEEEKEEEEKEEQESAPVEKEETAIKEQFLLPIFFHASKIRPIVSNNKEMKEIIADLKDSSAQIELMGHASVEGKEDNNYRLGELRAKRTKQFLVSRGISEDRIVINSRGSTSPIAPNNSEWSRRKNRRISVRLVHR